MGTSVAVQRAMDFLGTRTLVSLLFLATLPLAACSSTAAPARDEPALLDASQPSDAGTTVWQADSTGFELVSSGGAPDYGPDGAVCAYSVTWRFDSASRTLTRTGQSACQTADAAVALGPTAAAVLETRLTTLLATPTGGCGADGAETVFTVLGAAGAQHSYPGTTYAACPGLDAGAGPFVDDNAIAELTSLLDGFLDACKNADGGAPVDAGVVCM
jgi:hypothetical protein